VRARQPVTQRGKRVADRLRATAQYRVRRLDFEVENGLYQGKRRAIGFDGIWRAEGEPDLIVEVKTTDYVTVVEGEIHAELDDGVLVALRTGDTTQAERAAILRKARK